MDTILQGLEGVVCYIDDVLVTGKTTEQHLKILEMVFTRIREYRLRFNWANSRFLEKSVEYLDYVIDREGIHTSPKKLCRCTSTHRPG